MGEATYVRLKDPEAREWWFNLTGMHYVPVKPAPRRGFFKKPGEYYQVDVSALSMQAKDRISRILSSIRHAPPEKDEQPELPDELVSKLVIPAGQAEKLEKKCEACGKPVADTDVYCPYCGSPTGVEKKEALKTVETPVPQIRYEKPVSPDDLNAHFESFENVWSRVLEFLGKIGKTFGVRMIMINADGSVQVSFRETVQLEQVQQNAQPAQNVENMNVNGKNSFTCQACGNSFEVSNESLRMMRSRGAPLRCPNCGKNIEEGGK